MSLSLLIVGLFGTKSHATETLVYETNFVLGHGEVDYISQEFPEIYTQWCLSSNSRDYELNTVGNYYKVNEGFMIQPDTEMVNYIDDGYKLKTSWGKLKNLEVTDHLTYNFHNLSSDEPLNAYFGINFINREGKNLFTNKSRFKFIIEGETKGITAKTNFEISEYRKASGTGGAFTDKIATKPIEGKFISEFEYIRNYERPREEWGYPFPPTLFFGVSITETQDNNYGEVNLTNMKIYKVDETKVQSVTISPNAYTVKTGKSKLLYTKIKPDTAVNKKVAYKSSDPSTVKVFSNGKVQGIKPGVATITAITDDGGFTAESIITVE